MISVTDVHTDRFLWSTVGASGGIRVMLWLTYFCAYDLDNLMPVANSRLFCNVAVVLVILSDWLECRGNMCRFSAGKIKLFLSSETPRQAVKHTRPSVQREGSIPRGQSARNLELTELEPRLRMDGSMSLHHHFHSWFPHGLLYP